MKDAVKRVKVVNEAPMGFVLFLAYIGAAVYFWMQAAGFWEHIWAFIKAIAWPAILIYHVFTLLHV